MGLWVEEVAGLDDLGFLTISTCINDSSELATVVPEDCVGDVEGVDETEGASGILLSLILLNASLVLLSSNSFTLEANILLVSSVSLREVSACLSLVLTRPSSILSCSCW